MFQLDGNNLKLCPWKYTLKIYAFNFFNTFETNKAQEIHKLAVSITRSFCGLILRTFIKLSIVRLAVLKGLYEYQILEGAKDIV